MSRHKRAVRAWVTVAQEMLPAYFTPDCCLAATAIGLDALAAFRVQAVPMPVRVVAYNAAYARRIARLKRLSSSPAETLEWWQEDRSWVLGLGFPEDSPGRAVAPLEPGKWPGHLAIFCHGWLVDVTLGQASRPDRDLELPPAASFQFPELTRGRGGRYLPRIVHPLENGCWLDISLAPENVSFRDTPGFAGHRPMYHRDILPGVLERMKKLM